ncbi:Small-subunit processome, Utp14 [Artemisia annua]|uniref:Small-subunit processome, Utp14 n=1 Tax=Artemisia annua TaxID=35608 RepID=A0A2U1KJL8_ARTAN|nr:Small-subunit processome, Utp14 [Artemisia annua]
MADTKRKKNQSPHSSKDKRKKTGKDNKKWKKGPNLSNPMKKEIESLKAKSYSEINSDEDVGVKDVDVGVKPDSDEEIKDFYEYDEQIPQEELMKNRRYDAVDNFEYQLPDDFEDEDVASDDEVVNVGSKKVDSDDDSDEDDDEDEAFDDEKHSRMLQDITKLPGEAFEGKKKKNDVVVYEAYPESEYNPSRDVLDGDGRITIDDLLNPIHGKPGFNKIRKDVQRMGRKSMSIQPPLPKPQQEKLDRRSTYKFTKENLSEFNPQVKKNREATTMYFNEDINLGYNTVGAIAAEFKPRTEFEKKMASIINDKDITDAHKEDGAKLLELKKVSVEDVKERQDRLAKMRNLLFHHEVKAKRIKNIKSKTYRRLSKKDRLKATDNEVEMNPDVAKELAEKEEFRRAEERLTLKHKNTSKWAKRIKKRGFDIQDDGTRAAISEQLQQHALLTRKRNSMHDDDSSDDSSEDDDEDISEDEDDASKLKLLERGKKRTLEVLGEDDDEPKSGVLSLPFMVRGQKKKKEAADEEARLALQEFESSLKQLEGDDDTKDHVSSVGGRKTFGAQKKQVPKSKVKADKDNYFDNTDSEDDADTIQDDVNDKHGRQAYAQKDVTVDTNILREEAEVEHDSLFKSFEDIAKDSGPKIKYDVSLVTANSSKKKKKNKKESKQVKSENKAKDKKPQVTELASNKDTEIEHGGDDNDTDDEVQMIDGVITSGTDYELPSQDDLIRRAFAGDDVEEDFEMSKQEILNEENPEPEEPVSLPGWGQWTRIQKKRGPPAWMLAEYERAKKKRDEDLKKRPDAHLKHVIISEKVDKKAEKLQLKVLPFPYKDKEHYERSNRMPLGPEFNPATTVGLLNRPEVVKKPGVSIKPIKLRKK